MRNEHVPSHDPSESDPRKNGHIASPLVTSPISPLS